MKATKSSGLVTALSFIGWVVAALLVTWGKWSAIEPDDYFDIGLAIIGGLGCVSAALYYYNKKKYSSGFWLCVAGSIAALGMLYIIASF